MQGVETGKQWNYYLLLFTAPSWFPWRSEKLKPAVSVGQPAQKTRAYHGKKSSSFRWPLVELNPKAHSAIFSIYGVLRMEIGKAPYGPAPKDLLDPSQLCDPLTLGWKDYIRAAVRDSGSRRSYLFLYFE